MKNLTQSLLTILFLLLSIQAHSSTDHKDLNDVLQASVNDGQVNYPAIKEDNRFPAYLNYLINTNPDDFSTQEEKLAFWINAYNALTIKGILDGLSPGGFFSRITFFKSTKYEVAGRKINLYDLERDVIIPFKEPRIHFAINCASASCPNLISEAYTAENLEQHLEANTKIFVNDDFKNNFNLETKQANISKIFDWFKKDFAEHSGSVQKYLANYVDDPAVAQLLAEDGFKINYLKYDWSLNGTPLK